MKLSNDKFDSVYEEKIKKNIMEKKRKENKKVERKQLLNVGAIFMIVLVLLFVIANVVSGYIKINDMKHDNNVLVKEIETLKEDINRLNIKINKEVQHKIDKAFKDGKLNLYQPKADQIINLKLKYSFVLNQDEKSDIVVPKGKILSASK